jgi:peptidoglycan/xylan/chitin deacetylase (PgdA/CDA1 family)
MPDRWSNGRARELTKACAYRSGALAVWRSLRKQPTLTVVMFHRVLPAADVRSTAANPHFTVSTELFGECLDFLAAQYSIVSLEDVQSARDGTRRLPADALLITFDDGWSDTAEYALPLLQKRGMPAVVFVASSAIGHRDGFWQETLVAAVRTAASTAPLETVWERLGEEPPTSGDQLLEITRRRLDMIRLDERLALLRGLTDVWESGPPAMLSAAQIIQMQRNGFAIGCHGVSHEPFASATQASDEVIGWRQHVAGLPGWRNDRAMETLSFPHGCYSGEVLEAVRDAGYSLLFTSDPSLNRLDRRGSCGDVLGRIPIVASEVARPDGHLAAHRLACWLFLRTAH